MSEKFEQLSPTLPEQTKQDRIDLSKFGLKNDSWLEKTLNGQDKEKYETAITGITEEISKTFSPFQADQDIIRAVFTALDNHWVSRCQIPKDFRQCAELVIDIAKSQIRRNEKGEVENNQYFDGEKITTTAFLIKDLAEKAGGSFMQNADTLRLIIKDSIDMGFQKADVIGTMWSFNHGGLLFSGESLRAIRQLVKSASERKIDVKDQLKNLFGDNYAKDTGKRDEKGYTVYEPDDIFKRWRDLSKDKFAFDEDLWVIANSFQYDNDPASLVKKFNTMTTEEQNTFVSNARKFISKGISPQVIADNSNLIYSCDLQKAGLAVFNRSEDKKWWLEYCAQVWKYNPASIDFTKRFFNEAISSEMVETVVTKEWNIPNIKGFSGKELDESQRDVDEELGAREFRTIKEVRPDEQLREYACKLLQSTLDTLYESEEFGVIFKIYNSIEGSKDLITSLDKEKSNKINGSLVKFVTKFGSDEEKILPLTFTNARKLISEGLETDLDLADYFLENFSNYYKQPWGIENITKAIKHYSVAQKFIFATEQDNTVWKNEKWVSNVSTQAKAVVAEHQKHWDQDDDQDSETYKNRHGNEGFSISDPYENDPWRFTAKEANLSTVLANAIDGDIEAIMKLGRHDVDRESCINMFSEIKRIINSCFYEFTQSVSMNPKINEDDKISLISPEKSAGKIRSLSENVKFFISRYIVQRYEGNLSKFIDNIGDKNWLNEVVTDEENKEWSGNYPRGKALLFDIEYVMTEGFNKFIKVHEVEIPLYDKLYEEFDNLRETGRYPLEVFLGRDGIYAWIGRRSQDVSRRRKAGLEGRRKLREHGEVLEIHPQYTVYPRYFRDKLNYETKRKFLEQEGISQSADPLFYDTGYTGTIPEQIMRVMDFSDEEIEKRIRLLSAPHAHRRVKGIAENARHEIVEYIEHNAKTEGTAEGLIVDEKTGRIRHIAKPTTPQEQFYFMMVKQAISRHYWLQERLYHEPSENVNLDSEHYTIRMRQEYAKVLPQDFVKDPKEFFSQHGELLKGSKGEGDYPDEEVILFKMTDGTEIVAKKIELRKAKEARKEFSILISAKKAGLPTAEPVGFVSGKEEKDGSYLLMRKLEGFSGRNFGKHLRESGKFSEEQVKTILETIVEKNKEMAELFRKTLKIDKRWRIKDTIIEFNEETGEVGSVTPIDWERTQDYNPSSPKEIDEIV